MDHAIIIHPLVIEDVATTTFHTPTDGSLLGRDEADARAKILEKHKLAESVLKDLGLPLSAMQASEMVGGEMGPDAPADERYRMSQGWTFTVPQEQSAPLIDALFAKGYEFNGLIEFKADPAALAAAEQKLRAQYAAESARVFMVYAQALGLPFSPQDVTYNVNFQEESFGGYATLEQSEAKNLTTSRTYIGGAAQWNLPKGEARLQETSKAKQITVNYLASAPQDWQEIFAGIQLKGPAVGPLLDQAKARSVEVSETLLAWGIAPSDIKWKTVQISQTRPDPVFPEGVTSVPTPAPDGFEILREIRLRLRDPARKDAVLAEIAKAGMGEGLVMPGGSDHPEALRDAARIEAITKAKAKIKNGTLIGISEHNFADVVYETHDKDSAGTPLQGRASGGVSLTVSYVP